MQDRIDRLEGLVLSLMTNGSQSAGPVVATQALSMSSTTLSPDDVQDDHIKATDEGQTMSRGDRDEVESETDQVSQSLGLMKVQNNQSTYFGDAHWATILSDVCYHSFINKEAKTLQIAEVKTYFAEHQKQYEDQLRKVQESRNREEASGPTFLFGGTSTAEYSELLASLPKRSVTDKLVSRYFNSYDPAIRMQSLLIVG